jgi:hypothetical protein
MKMPWVEGQQMHLPKRNYQAGKCHEAAQGTP